LSHQFIENAKSYDEVETLNKFKNYNREVKSQFLSQILKVGQTIEGLNPPFKVQMFLDLVQSLFSLLSQILGLDYDALVIEVMLGIFFFFFDPESSPGAFRLMISWLKKCISS